MSLESKLVKHLDFDIARFTRTRYDGNKIYYVELWYRPDRAETRLTYLYHVEKPMWVNIYLKRDRDGYYCSVDIDKTKPRTLMIKNRLLSKEQYEKIIHEIIKVIQ